MTAESELQGETRNCAGSPTERGPLACAAQDLPLPKTMAAKRLAPEAKQPVAPGGSSTPGTSPARPPSSSSPAGRGQGPAEALCRAAHAASAALVCLLESARGPDTSSERDRPLTHFHGTKRPPAPSPPSRPLIPSRQRRDSTLRLRAELRNHGPIATGRTALASISKDPCNSSLLFSSFVCFSLKQWRCSESQFSLYSSTDNCLGPTQSSADGPVPAPERRMGAGLPLALPLPAPSPRSTPCSDFNSISGRKQQQLQGNGAWAAEVTSQASRLEKRCLNRALRTQAFLLMHRGTLPFNSHLLVESLTAAVLLERQSLTVEKSLKYVTQEQQKAWKWKDEVLRQRSPPPPRTTPRQARSSPQHPAATCSCSPPRGFKPISCEQQQHNLSPVATTNITSIILLYRCVNVLIWWVFLGFLRFLQHLPAGRGENRRGIPGWKQLEARQDTYGIQTGTTLHRYLPASV